MERLRNLLLSVACGVALTSQAQVLLTVDVTNPAAVTYTATGALASAGDGTHVHVYATLVGFFTAPAPAVAPDLVARTLSDFVTGSPYSQQLADGANLRLWTFGLANINVPLFAGSDTGDLSAAGAFLPPNGASGNILLEPGLGTVPGQWQAVAVVVPEPHEYALMAGTGLLGFAAWRRRRRS